MRLHFRSRPIIISASVVGVLLVLFVVAAIFSQRNVGVTTQKAEQPFNYDTFKQNVMDKISSVGNATGDDKQFIMKMYLPVRDAIQEAEPIITAKKKKMVTDFMLSAKKSGKGLDDSYDQMKLASILIAKYPLASVNLDKPDVAVFTFAVTDKISVDISLPYTKDFVPASFADDILKDPSRLVSYAKKLTYTAQGLSLQDFQSYYDAYIRRSTNTDKGASDIQLPLQSTTPLPKELYAAEPADSNIFKCGTNNSLFSSCNVVAYYALLHGKDPAQYYFGLKNIVGTSAGGTPVNMLGMPITYCSDVLPNIVRHCQYFDQGSLWCSDNLDQIESDCYTDPTKTASWIRISTVSNATKRYGDLPAVYNSTGPNKSVQQILADDIQSVNDAFSGKGFDQTKVLNAYTVAITSSNQYISNLQAGSTENWQKVQFIHDEADKILHEKLGSPWLMYVYGVGIVAAGVGGFFVYRTFKRRRAATKSSHHHHSK